MAMTYDAFLEQMKKDLEAGFAGDLPAKYSQVKIEIRDVEKLQSINQAEVAPADRLSDHVYHYDQTDRVFELAEKTAGRKLEQKLAKKAEQRDPAERKSSVLAQLGEKKKYYGYQKRESTIR